jgi:predicted anti-sigma-YlaC factor YlaD
MIRGSVISRRSIAALLLVGLLAACSPRQFLLNQAADAWTAQGQAEEEDIGLAREASAFYLKASEALLRQTPGHLPLAESVASGLTQYAYAFVAFEAERLQASAPQAAHRLNLRAHRHAMAALALSNPALVQALKPAKTGPLPQLRKEEVGLTYWAAASWGAYIALSKDDPDAVADLPLAIGLAELAWKTSPQFGDGALASLMGNFEAARPGGSASTAAAYFNQAMAISAGLNAGPYVAKAEAIALPAGDRPAFEALLKQALAASEKRTDLSNQIMRERAQWLLDAADDLF